VRPEHWIVLVIAATVCIPVFLTQVYRLVKFLPRVANRALSRTDRIEAQNRVFGAIIGGGLTGYGLFCTIWFAVQEFRGG